MCESCNYPLNPMKKVLAFSQCYTCVNRWHKPMYKQACTYVCAYEITHYMKWKLLKLNLTHGNSGVNKWVSWFLDLPDYTSFISLCFE